MARRFCSWASSAYSNAISSQPLPTKIATVSLMTFAGDLNAQCIEALRGQREAVFDGQRSFAFTSFNIVFSGLIGHFYYNRLERAFPMCTGGVKAVLSKLFITQGLWTPFWYLPCYCFWTGSLLGRSFEQNAEKLRTGYSDLVIASWSTSGVANIMMFWFVPARHHVGVSALGHFVMSSLASLIFNKDRKRSSSNFSEVQGGDHVCDSVPFFPNHLVSGTI